MIEIKNQGRAEVRKELKEKHNVDYKEYCTVYDKDIIDNNTKVLLADMRNDKNTIKIIEPHFVSYSKDDKERKFHIYYYKMNEVDIFKKHCDFVNNIHFSYIKDIKKLKKESDNIVTVNEYVNKLYNLNKNNYKSFTAILLIISFLFSFIILDSFKAEIKEFSNSNIIEKVENKNKRDLRKEVQKQKQI